jgi:hypothetical protein
LKSDSRCIKPFDSDKHAGLGLDSDYLGHYISSCHVVPINLVELFYALRHYPVVFTVRENGYELCAVTGLQSGINLYCDREGKWIEEAYIPAFVRRLPFYTAVAQDGNKSGKQVVLVDEAGLSKSASPFFNQAGIATDLWHKQEKFIADFISAQEQTERFSARLSKLNLLEPFDAQINPRNHDNMQLTGMYRVNENRLNNLPAKVIKELMQGGDLSRLYGHLISLENFAKLLDLSSNRLRNKNTH